MIVPHPETSRPCVRRPGIPLDAILFAICLAATLASLFYKLGPIPAGLFLDETSLGYDAQCLLRTGADQHGVRWPLFFKSFGDYKSPVFLYLTALNELWLGPSEAAVRITSAELVVMIAFCIGWLTKSLTGRPRLAGWLGLFTGLIPTFFFFGRIATSESIALAAVLAVALNLMLAFEARPKPSTAIAAGVALSGMLYTYHVGRLVAPLAVATAAVTYAFSADTRRQLWAFLTAAGVAAAPAALFMVRHPEALAHRFNTGVGLWRDHPSWWVATQRFCGTYFQHLFYVDYLFRTGQHQDSLNMGSGLMSIWMWLPFVVGLAALWQRRQAPFIRFVMAMLVFAPIPVALTWENLPHTGRITHLLVLAMVPIALAIHDWLERDRPSRLVLALVTGCVLLEGVENIGQYFVLYAPAARRNRYNGDENIGDALKLVARLRTADEPVYLPESFFKDDNTYLDFYLNLDPARRSDLAALHLLHASQPRPPEMHGLWVAARDQKPLPPAELLETTPLPDQGGPAWQVFRFR